MDLQSLQSEAIPSKSANSFVVDSSKSGKLTVQPRKGLKEPCKNTKMKCDQEVALCRDQSLSSKGQRSSFEDERSTCRGHRKKDMKYDSTVVGLCKNESPSRKGYSSVSEGEGLCCKGHSNDPTYKGQNMFPRSRNLFSDDNLKPFCCKKFQATCKLKTYSRDNEKNNSRPFNKIQQKCERNFETPVPPSSDLFFIEGNLFDCQDSKLKSEKVRKNLSECFQKSLDLTTNKPSESPNSSSTYQESFGTNKLKNSGNQVNGDLKSIKNFQDLSANGTERSVQNSLITSKDSLSSNGFNDNHGLLQGRSGSFGESYSKDKVGFLVAVIIKVQLHFKSFEEHFSLNKKNIFNLKNFLSLLQENLT